MTDRKDVYDRMQKHKSMFRNCEFNIGDGWMEIVADALDEIAPISSGIVFSKIVTRNGTLRMIVRDYGPDVPSKKEIEISKEAVKIDRILVRAELASETTCQECGEPGLLITNGKKSTVMCFEHRMPIMTGRMNR